MTARKFYKKVYRVEVLSMEPIPDGIELENVLEESTVGWYSSDIHEDAETVLNGEDMAKELVKQRSDPGFFGLTSDGNDVW